MRICSECSKRIWHDGILTNNVGDRTADGGTIAAKRFVGETALAVVRYDDGRATREVRLEGLAHDEAWFQEQLCRCGR